MKRSRTSESHLQPQQRRRAIILLLTVGLARVAGADEAPGESLPAEASAEAGAESPQKALGSRGEITPCVPTG
ncbi:MAG: hypothetical protein WBF17_10125 [Phycisphaerae bacterium]